MRAGAVLLISNLCLAGLGQTAKEQKKLPKRFQIGTIVESAFDGPEGRLTKKERKGTIAQALLHDETFQCAILPPLPPFCVYTDVVEYGHVCVGAGNMGRSLSRRSATMQKQQATRASRNGVKAVAVANHGGNSILLVYLDVMCAIIWMKTR